MYYWIWAIVIFSLLIVMVILYSVEEIYLNKYRKLIIEHSNYKGQYPIYGKGVNSRDLKLILIKLDKK